MNQHKYKIIGGVVLVVLVLVVLNQVGFLGRSMGYSVVYLTTGEVYVGKLSTFPDFELKDGYILQVAKNPEDPTKNSFQLNPISQALWAPKSMHLNRKQVVFYGSLLPGSAIAKKLAEQAK